MVYWFIEVAIRKINLCFIDWVKLALRHRNIQCCWVEAKEQQDFNSTNRAYKMHSKHWTCSILAQPCKHARLTRQKLRVLVQHVFKFKTENDDWLKKVFLQFKTRISSFQRYLLILTGQRAEWIITDPFKTSRHKDRIFKRELWSYTATVRKLVILELTSRCAEREIRSSFSIE